MKKKQQVFGFELVMDLKECDLEVMSSKKKLQEYVDRLCEVIDMKKYGKTFIPYFGLNEAHTKGYSLVQLIETSSITGHFSEFWRTAYINVFTCKTFDKDAALKFTRDFFKAKKVTARYLIRK